MTERQVCGEIYMLKNGRQISRGSDELGQPHCSERDGHILPHKHGGYIWFDASVNMETIKSRYDKQRLPVLDHLLQQLRAAMNACDLGKCLDEEKADLGAVYDRVRVKRDELLGSLHEEAT